jgi:antitoxin FitA
MASLTIRGLDDALRTQLRVEAARRGYSTEEAARQILRRALMGPDVDAGCLGSRVHRYLLEAEAYDLEIPARSAPSAVPDLADRRA